MTRATAARHRRDPFEALGDPNRRAILALLGDRGRSVQELADALPISRPAVSRHLRLLKEAELVTEEARGTRRIYRVQEQGIQAVRGYLEEVWGEAAARFRLMAENTTPSTVIDPIWIEFDVACTPEHAFDTWTTRIGDWWPSSHSVTGLPGIEVVLEGWAGGRIFERAPGGAEHDWGEITLWEPPSRLGYLWHLRSDRAAATDVEIRFVARDESTTRVEIEHRGWERLGAEAPSWRDRNRAGWDGLLPHFRDAAIRT